MGYTADSLSSYTIGTASGAIAANGAPTVTYAALKDTYQLSIAVDGLGASETITAGTQLSFPATSLINMQNKNTLAKR